MKTKLNVEYLDFMKCESTREKGRVVGRNEEMMNVSQWMHVHLETDESSIR